MKQTIKLTYLTHLNEYIPVSTISPNRDGEQYMHHQHIEKAGRCPIIWLWEFNDEI